MRYPCTAPANGLIDAVPCDNLEIMTPGQRKQIDDEHRQKYLDSCPGSTIEMLLKLNRAVPPDFYQYQDADPNGLIGVGNYVDQKLEGDWRLRRIPQAAAWAFPLPETKAKLAAGQVVAIFDNPAGRRAHGWLVDEIRPGPAGEDEVVLRSKYSEDGSGKGKSTAVDCIKISDLSKHRWSDPIFLEKP